MASTRDPKRRLQIKLTAINKPDPEVVAVAAAPLILDWMRREREKKEAIATKN